MNEDLSYDAKASSDTGKLERKFYRCVDLIFHLHDGATRGAPQTMQTVCSFFPFSSQVLPVAFLSALSMLADREVRCLLRDGEETNASASPLPTV